MLICGDFSIFKRIHIKIFSVLILNTFYINKDTQQTQKLFRVLTALVECKGVSVPQSPHLDKWGYYLPCIVVLRTQWSNTSKSAHSTVWHIISSLF